VIVVSNPAPSSVTVNWRLPSEQERPTVERDALGAVSLQVWLRLATCAFD
jgi:hypothetical protein